MNKKLFLAALKQKSEMATKEEVLNYIKTDYQEGDLKSLLEIYSRKRVSEKNIVQIAELSIELEKEKLGKKDTKELKDFVKQSIDLFETNLTINAREALKNKENAIQETFKNRKDKKELDMLAEKSNETIFKKEYDKKRNKMEEKIQKFEEHIEKVNQRVANGEYRFEQKIKDSSIKSKMKKDNSNVEALIRSHVPNDKILEAIWEKYTDATVEEIAIWFYDSDLEIQNKKEPITEGKEVHFSKVAANYVKNKLENGEFEKEFGEVNKEKILVLLEDWERENEEKMQYAVSKNHQKRKEAEKRLEKMLKEATPNVLEIFTGDNFEEMLRNGKNVPLSVYKIKLFIENERKFKMEFLTKKAHDLENNMTASELVELLIMQTDMEIAKMNQPTAERLEILKKCRIALDNVLKKGENFQNNLTEFKKLEEKVKQQITYLDVYVTKQILEDQAYDLDSLANGVKEETEALYLMDQIRSCLSEKQLEDEKIEKHMLTLLEKKLGDGNKIYFNYVKKHRYYLIEELKELFKLTEIETQKLTEGQKTVFEETLREYCK